MGSVPSCTLAEERSRSWRGKSCEETGDDGPGNRLWDMPPTLDIHGDCKSAVDRVNGMAREGDTFAEVSCGERG